jgi:3-deoxy-D-manno-octulosonate 8-phosphate phosphatase (KDO 8-P phosphatase)
MSQATSPLSAIRLLILDVDGVLADGRIVYDQQGNELKSFHVRDGLAIKLWQQTGRQVAIISGRSTQAVARRANELGIEWLMQGVGDKLAALRQLLGQTGLTAEQAAAMGDDLPDWPLAQTCAAFIAPADACPEIRRAASYVTHAPGGGGVVREGIEWLLRQTRDWESLIAQYRVRL